MITVLGIDPGDTAGFLLAGWREGERTAAFARAFQCDGDSAVLLLGAIIGWEAEISNRVNAAGIEAFIESRKGLKGTSPAAIRAQVSSLRAVLCDRGIVVKSRNAATVKGWADDERLARAGLIEATAGMPRHARDAARHALFTAVRDCGLPDPLSRRARGEPGNVP